MQQLIEENYEFLNSAKENGTTETIEERDKLHQIMEEQKVMLCKLVRIKTCLGNNLRTWNIILMKRGEKSGKVDKIIQVLQK